MRGGIIHLRRTRRKRVRADTSDLTCRLRNANSFGDLSLADDLVISFPYFFTRPVAGMCDGDGERTATSSILVRRILRTRGRVIR